MTSKWIEEFLFPEKTLESSGRQPLKLDYIHKELAKKNVKLSLLHHEYEVECRTNHKIPYSYRSFVCHYSKYADKYKATLGIRRKPAEIMRLIGQAPQPLSLMGIQLKSKGRYLRCDTVE